MTLRSEINEIPARAADVQQATDGLRLPANVPYLGMGSSYFAALTLRYAGAPVIAELASEFDMYLGAVSLFQSACLISQSGNSTETVWCLDRFDQVTAVVNDVESTIGTSPKSKQLVDVLAGAEAQSSTKSYVNTLIVLYQGHGFNCRFAVDELTSGFGSMAQRADALATRITARVSKPGVGRAAGLYVLGSGPNLATAMQSALVLTETTKLPWQAMSVAGFDHGPKEAASDATVLMLDSGERDSPRLQSLAERIQSVGGHVEVVRNTGGDARLSPISIVTEVSLVMASLAEQLDVGETFVVGGKVTTVDNSLR